MVARILRLAALVLPVLLGPLAAASQDAPRFAFQRMDVDQSGLQPRVCLGFNAALQSEGVRPADYIATAPQLRLAASIEGERLCLVGFAYGTDYEIEIRRGLQAADGRRLAGAERVSLALTARPPVVAFTGGGRVLVRAASDGLPVTTVNVPELAIQVFRVGERGLAGLRRQLRENERRTYEY